MCINIVINYFNVSIQLIIIICYVIRWTRHGLSSRTLWAPHVEQFASAWLDTTEEVWEEHEPHTDSNYDAYLSWYVTRTRQFVTYAADVGEEVVPQRATVADMVHVPCTS